MTHRVDASMRRSAPVAGGFPHAGDLTQRPHGNRCNAASR
jgi:hypothetical protein